MNFFSHDVQHFILFLENYDGKSVNELMKDLCSIYKKSVEDGFDFIALASARAASFVNFFYPVFWAKYAENKQEFFESKIEIVSFVATSIANSAFAEFELGNLV
jgi:hypothetical protein